jgi:hypothetical protein
MKAETIKIIYEDYLDYQRYYREELDFVMEETFVDYVQRCIDIGEFAEWIGDEEDE